MEPSPSEDKLEFDKNLRIPPNEEYLSTGLSFIFPPLAKGADRTGYDLSSIEVGLIVDDITKEVSGLNVAFTDGRWFELGGVDAQTSNKILGYLSSVAGLTKDESESLDLDAAWSAILDLLPSDSRKDVKDIMAFAADLFSRGEFPPFLAVPSILQGITAWMAIDAGLSEAVFNNLILFRDDPGPVVTALLDIRDPAYSERLFRSLESQDGVGLSGLNNLDFETAKSLIGSAIHYSAVTEVDTNELRVLLRNIHKFRYEDVGNIHQFLRETLLKCNEGQQLFEIYEEMGKDRGKLLFELISIVNGWTPESEVFLDKSRNWNRLPRNLAADFQMALAEAEDGIFVPFDPNRKPCTPDISGLDHPKTFEEAERSIEEIYNLGEKHRFKPGNYRALVATMVESALGAPGIDHMTLAGLLIVLGHTDVLLNKLEVFSGLSNGLAKFLLAHGPGSIVIQNAEAFEQLDSSTILTIASKSFNIRLLQKFNSLRWDKETFIRAFELIIAENDFQKVLDNLSGVPEKYLSLTEDRFYLSSYLRDIGIPSNEIYKIYRELKEKSDELAVRGFCSEVQRIVESMVSSAPLSKEIEQSPYFNHIVSAVFTSHAHMWGPVGRHSKGKPQDCSQHVSKFNLRPRYRISLAEGTLMILKKGNEENESAIFAVKEPIVKIQDELARVGFDKGLMWELLESRLDRIGDTIPYGSKNKEEKILTLMLECLCGNASERELKDVLLMYHFAVVENIRGYFEGTRDFAARSKTPRYSELMYMREFFADAMRDTTNKICKEALQRGAIKERLASYHARLGAKEVKREQDEAVNRAQIDKVGITPKLLTLLSQKITEQGVSSETRKRAVASIISREQERLSVLMEKLLNVREKPETLHLDTAGTKVRDFLSQETLQNEAAIGGGKKGSHKEFDEKYFKSYITEALALAFREELKTIDLEISKYKPSTGERKSALVLEGFITKNSQSFWARSVAGVCVAQDTWQWDQPDYIQMVLRDSVTKRCEGLLMLHTVIDRGRKILVVSFQPTSTYLFKVDETQLFGGLMDQLIVFCQENDFDMIASSSNHAIRTNRTGGAFEMALDRRVRDVSKRIRLKSKLQFSKSVEYKIDEIDVLWESKGVSTEKH